MRRTILQFACVLSLLFFAAPSLFAQFEEATVNALPPIDDYALNKRNCLSATETQIDKCPTNEPERNCPSGNCDWNYIACRIYGPTPNNEYSYAVSEVTAHEIENPKEVAAGGSGFKPEDNGGEVCYKRQNCVCRRDPGVSATCITEPEVTKVVIRKWKANTVPCVKEMALDPE